MSEHSKTSLLGDSLDQLIENLKDGAFIPYKVTNIIFLKGYPTSTK